MDKLTEEQKIVLTGFTGVLLCDSFADFQKAVEFKLARPVYTHEFADKEFSDKVKELFWEDAMRMCGLL